MMTTDQENAVRAWVVAAIAGCPDLEPIPLEKVVWSGQDFPAEMRPYALITYTGTDELGATPSQTVDDNDDLNTKSLDDTTVSITIVIKPSDTNPTRAQVASSYIREMKARARSFISHILTDAKLTVRQVFTVPDASRLAGRSQWESRGVLDLLLGHALVVTESPGVIVTAEISGSTEPPTPSQPSYIAG